MDILYVFIQITGTKRSQMYEEMNMERNTYKSGVPNRMGPVGMTCRTEGIAKELKRKDLR